MMLIVPVGAIVVTVALRSGGVAALRRSTLHVEVREGAPLARRGSPEAACDSSLDEAHHLLAQRERLVGVVGDAERDQHVGEAHHAEADLAVRRRVMCADLGSG